MADLIVVDVDGEDDVGGLSMSFSQRADEGIKLPATTWAVTTVVAAAWSHGCELVPPDMGSRKLNLGPPRPDPSSASTCVPPWPGLRAATVAPG